MRGPLFCVSTSVAKRPFGYLVNSSGSTNGGLSEPPASTRSATAGAEKAKAQAAPGGWKLFCGIVDQPTIARPADRLAVSMVAAASPAF